MPAPDQERGFEGVWRTTFGMMRLTREGDRVHGVYGSQAGSRIEGSLVGGRLAFRYEEPDATGEGSFGLSEDGREFTGRWRQDGATEWYEWAGWRLDAPPAPGERSWLVVLEARWEEDLHEQEYTFGAMLKAYFARSEEVHVMHRIVHDRDDLRRWCNELLFVEAPVYLCLAAHGDPDGLELAHEKVGGEDLAAILGRVPSLRLVHFSACNAMAGDIPRTIVEACSSTDGEAGLAGVSGYEVEVDWAGSALIEFFYLDLMLLRDYEPRRAARQVLRSLAFAGSESQGLAIDPAHFRFLTAD